MAVISDNIILDQRFSLIFLTELKNLWNQETDDNIW